VGAVGGQFSWLARVDQIACRLAKERIATLVRGPARRGSPSMNVMLVPKGESEGCTIA
jgi:hypothetical protein